MAEAADIVEWRARSVVSVARAARAVKYREALELRALGFEFWQIAEAMSIDEGTAEKLVLQGLKQTLKEPAAEVRQLELKRLDMLMQAFMQRAIEGHGPSCDRVLMIMERRARLEGLDAPVEIDFNSIRSRFMAVLRRAQDAAGVPIEEQAKVLQAMTEIGR